MHPFQWCNGCFCGLGLVSTNKSCSMPPISFQDLPLNIYMVIFGTGIFVFMLSLIFCCYFIRITSLQLGLLALRTRLSLPFAGPLRPAVSICISLSSCPAHTRSAWISLHPACWPVPLMLPRMTK
ncbi:RING finger protein 122 isoform X4 [Bubalus kerabau]|uniref:RING finger protein 122 isoform X4 n=1 Tax=Bubalus carabanensis TaxID=3119969 RepID=UPI00244E68C0|nr:RING finger protein 122 isoform X4 [Bubalus carabanensis]